MATTRMYNPPHPGEVLQDTVLAQGRITVSEFAKKLGVSRVALSRVVNARAAVSADMALRLAAALGASRTGLGCSGNSKTPRLPPPTSSRRSRKTIRER